MKSDYTIYGLIVNNEFEFDKVALAIGLAIFTFVFSANLAGFIYTTDNFVETPGINIEVVQADAGAAPKGLPDILDMAAILASADPENGKAVFNKCAVCHTNNKDGANKVGPNLWGIVNAKTARHTEFAYSNAMAKRGQEGGTWGYESLYRYLYAPAKYVPGTKMAFAGIKNDKDRADLIAYLRTLADSQAPLPK